MATPAEPYPWLPLASVLAHLGAGDAQETAADTARRAACAYVERHRPDLVVPLDETDPLWVEVDGTLTWTGLEAAPVIFEPDGAIEYGALLLTARLYARRSTPQGIASFGEFGPGTILRLDPDIERLLGLGRNATPRVG